MDSSFVDLDILLTRIREPRSRAYFLEAVRSYKAGALRAALTSAWVAVAYDLISKYRELATMGDAAATAFLQTWDSATASGDVKRLLELESKIISDATSNTQALNRIAEIHLERLRQDRHLCAHPAFSTEADLFEPSPELVRLHLVNAIDLVLSQEPLQGKAILDQFDNDVQTIGFPNLPATVKDYVEQRYLARVRPQNIRNFGVVLAKSLTKNVPRQWSGYRKKIAAALEAVRDRAPACWPEVTASIVRLIDTLEPQHRERAIAFLGAFPDFWQPLGQPTKTALLETLANIDPVGIADFGFLRGVSLPVFKDRIEEIIGELSDEQVEGALADEVLLELWPRAVGIYQQSGSFRGSESNFRSCILPFSGQLTSQEHDQLLAAVGDNGQNWDAAETPRLLINVLEAGTARNLPSREARDEFYQQLRQQGRIESYDDVWPIFADGGWTPPAAARREGGNG